MDSKDTHNAKRELARLLQPCFADPPTAGAVILVNSAHGTRFFCVNMDSFEAGGCSCGDRAI